MELCLGGMAGLQASAAVAPDGNPVSATPGQHGFPGPQTTLLRESEAFGQRSV